MFALRPLMLTLAMTGLTARGQVLLPPQELVQGAPPLMLNDTPRAQPEASSVATTLTPIERVLRESAGPQPQRLNSSASLSMAMPMVKPVVAPRPQMRSYFSPDASASLPTFSNSTYFHNTAGPAALPINGPVPQRNPSQPATPAEGARKVMATLYQSCGVLDLDRLPASLAANQGSIAGLRKAKVNGVSRRTVTNPDLYSKNHYYLNSIDRRQEDASCVNLKRNPPIFDFGGKPKVTATRKTSSLDLLKNAGSGSSALGLDCSGFVTSSFLAAGYKMSPRGYGANEVNMRNSGSFANPKAPGGASCFDILTIDRDTKVQSGDLIAWGEHVLMIEDAGADPFGLESYKKASDCVDTSARQANKVDPRRYNFSLIQSSRTGGGLGVNRIEASTFFSRAVNDSPRVRKLVQKACLAKFGKTKPFRASERGLSIVRHKGTPECRTAPVKLAHEECVASCGGITE